MHDYDNDGFGGSQHTSNAFEAYKAGERESWNNLNKQVAKSAYDDLKAKYDEALKTMDNEYSANQRLRDAITRWATAKDGYEANKAARLLEELAESFNPSRGTE